MLSPFKVNSKKGAGLLSYDLGLPADRMGLACLQPYGTVNTLVCRSTRDDLCSLPACLGGCDKECVVADFGKSCPIHDVTAYHALSKPRTRITRVNIPRLYHLHEFLNVSFTVCHYM